MENKEKFINGKKYIMKGTALQLLGRKKYLPNSFRFEGVKIGKNVWFEEEYIFKYLKFESSLKEKYLSQKNMTQELAIHQEMMEKIINNLKPEGMLCWLDDK
ncbi:cell division protein FtsL, partial [Bacillus cereus]|nr:cell division protein FtsL [Bacillus cereus]